MRPRSVGVALVAIVLSFVARAQEPSSGIPACDPVQRTASGLQWCVLQKGRAEAPPGPDDTVQLHYSGWLESGKRFGTTRDGKKPLSMAVRDMQKGWNEGLQLMAPGARYKFVVPPDLAYGEQGAPGAGVPPNATVVYEIELLKVLRLPKLDPGKRKELANGMKFEIVAAGSGEVAKKDDLVALRFAIWTASGTLWDHTEQANTLIRGRLDELQPPMLKELLLGVGELKVGTVLHVEVPQSVYSNPGSDSVWELEVVSKKPKPEVPQFRLPDPKKVVTTQTGLAYEVITMGTGASPRRSDTVVLHYTGWLEDGTVFDSSHARGEPDEIPLTRVIRGWVEGVPLMKVGSKFLFLVPASLAYGSRGRDPGIPPNSNLVFCLELLDVKK